WPLNVFATPQGRPFFAGTYWPPRPIAGSASFRDVLSAVGEAWRDRRDGVIATADSLAEALAEVGSGVRQSADGDVHAVPTETELDAAIDAIAAQEDHQHGGFGTEPKFPMAPVLDFLAGREHGRALARRTLEHMARSDLRDPIEGGIFRYATKRDWTEPHYERMLYDN